MKHLERVAGLPCVLDDDDAARLSGLPMWVAVHGYALVWIDKKAQYVHRVVMGAMLGEVVDHINGNPLDNRKSNLRICTQRQNLMNARPRTDNASGVKGVSWSKRDERWRAFIYVNGKSKCLGDFKELADAVAARKRGEIEAYGEYAYKAPA